MSYEIIYERLSVKLSNNKYIPLILWGSNNCWEAYSNKRARSWSLPSFVTNGKIVISINEAVRNLEKMVLKEYEYHIKDEEYKDLTIKDFKERYSYFSGLNLAYRGNKGTTFNQLKSYIVNDMKKYAFDYEKFKEYFEPLTISIKKIGEEKDFYPKSEEELIKIIEKNDNLCENIYIYLSSYIDEQKVKEAKKEHFNIPKKRKKERLTENFYVAKIKGGDLNGLFLVRFTKYGYSGHFFAYSNSVRRFPNLGAFNKAREEMKRRSYKTDLEPVYIKSETEYIKEEIN